MDHSYFNEEIETSKNEDFYDNTLDKDSNLKIYEKEGDDYLIDLYRERRFLYDKREKYFKDNNVKENAWQEISKIMIEKKCGDYYTPDYCQKRIRTLREKFSRMQKNEQNYRSGSAASTEKKSPLLNQMSFLNTYIQRRRTYSNVKDNEEECESSKENTSTSFDNQTLSKKPKLENKITDKVNINKKEKPDEEKILGVIHDLTNSILSDSSKSSNLRSAETVFAEYIALELEKMNELERTIKKQKLMEVLITPLEKN